VTTVRSLLPALLLATLPAVVLAQIGPEFQVNTYTTLSQHSAAVAADAAGNFMVVWTGYGPGGNSRDILAQRYDSGGSPVGGEFQVNTYTPYRQSASSVAADGTGNFVVAWASEVQDGSGYGIFAQRLDNAGSPVGGEFQVNTYTTYNQSAPQVAADGAGNFSVVWRSPQDGWGDGIVGRRYDSAGSPVGGDFQVNTYTTEYQNSPEIAADGTGRTVVVWTTSFQFDPLGEVFGQRYDSAGNPAGGEFQVNTYTTGSQIRPSVAIDGTGNFVVVWTDHDSRDGSDAGVFGQRFDSSANPVGSEFQVNTYTTDGQGLFGTSVAADAAGNFMVVWDSLRQDGNEFGLFGQRYDSAGSPIGPEFPVNAHTGSRQVRADAAADGAGNFVAAWDSYGQDGSSYGVFGQRYDAAARQGVVGTLVKLADQANGKRRVIVRGREAPSNSTIFGDPLTYGATVQIVAHGDVDQDQTFNLPPGASAPGGIPGWKAVVDGWKYRDAQGVNGPVRRALVRGTFRRRVGVQVLIEGTAGSPPPGVALVPPGNGTDGGLIFSILGPQGGTYCVDLGGANGGTVTNSASAFSVRDAVTETGCPSL